MKLKGVEEVCIAHGAAGAAAAASVIGSARCSAGLVLLAASPLPTAAPTTAATLVLAGELDGVYRLSRFAVARQAATASTSTLKFGVVLGASHHSFAAGAGAGVGVPPSSTIPEAVAVLDLKQSLTASAVVVENQKETHLPAENLLEDAGGGCFIPTPRPSLREGGESAQQ